MTDSVSSRQKTLKQIWNSSGPNELLEIMAREPAARDGNIAVELRNESDACALVNPDLAKRLQDMADAVEQFHASINRFAAIEGMADLVALHKDFPFCWLRKFNRLLGAFWTDALRGGQTSRKDLLRRALGFLRDVYVTISLIQHTPQVSIELWVKKIQEHPFLCDPYFHEFLDERARFAALNGHASAEPFAQMASYVRDSCKTVSAITQLEHVQPGEEPVRLRLPLSPDMAELWFIVNEEFSTAMAEIAVEVSGGTQTLEAGIQAALGVGRATGDESGPSDTFYIAAFLEHLLRVTNCAIVEQAIDSYRGLVESGEWSSAESRATHILRYAKALLLHWRRLRDPLNRFEDAVRLIGDALPIVDVGVSPRLTRDLFFSRARLLENMGTWRPSAYESAAEEYSRGLAVPGLAHEREARGRALADYANTLSRIPSSDSEQHDRRIIDALEEALACHNSEDRTLSRALALNSYAIYLNERIKGGHAANQERALAMAQEAIDLIERARGEGLADNSDHVLRALAGAYLTKSNILRHREVADVHDGKQAGRDALRSAINRLGSAHDNQLRGVILLNLGHVNVDLYGITADPAHARDALYAYREAEALLQPYPREFSQALLGTAMLVTEVPESRTAEALEESLVATEKAISILEAASDAKALARAWFGLGELRGLRGQQGDYEDAIHAFNCAQAKFLEAGSHEGAVAAARRAAGIRVQQFKQGDPMDRVRQAKELLVTATRWIEGMWQQFDSVEWHYKVSDRFSNVYAEIAWCQATLEDPIKDLAFTIAQAKGREFIAHIHEVQRASHLSEGLAEYLDELRVEARLAEASRWRAQRQAQPDRSLDDTLRVAQRKLDEIAMRRRLLIPSPPHDEGSPPIAVVEGFLETHPAALVCDITISRWGTVVMLFGGVATGKLAGVKVQVLAADSETIQKWLINWLTAYASYLEAGKAERATKRAHWANRTEALLKDLGQHLMQPILPVPDEQTTGIQLIIAPGRLAGLPLHAATLAGARCVADVVRSAVYVPNIAVLSPEKDSWGPRGAALCVLSDPKGDLPSAAAESACVATEFQKRGANVTLLALVGRAVGQKALDERGLEVAQGVMVSEVAPTPEQISSRLPDCDHFFYSGHGISVAGQSGLILVDDNGHERLFAEDDVLAMHVLRRRPLVVLSACGTAPGSKGASAELFDLASSFLRIGAGFIIGSLWVVVEDCAQALTTEFYSALAQTNDASAAFGIALRAMKESREAASSREAKSVQSNHPIYWAPFVAMRGG